MMNERKQIHFTLESFEGPLDLLLHLIEKNEIDIYNIPITEVTSQFMEAIEEVERLDMNIASEFLIMAATLLEIKSKMLLPSSDLFRLEDEFSYEDPRYDLVLKLLEYKKYKNASDELKTREEEFGKHFYKEQSDMSVYVKPVAFKNQDITFDVQILVDAFEKLINQMDRLDESRKDYFSTLKRDVYTVEEKIEHIKLELLSKKRSYFIEYFKAARSKSEVIVTFLAILELLKQNYLTIVQDENYGEIELLIA